METTPATTSPLTLRRAIELFETKLRADGRSPHTVSSYLRDLGQMERFFAYRAVCPAISGITPEALSDFLVSPLAVQTPDGKPKAKITVNRAKCALRAFFSWLYANDHIGANLAAGLKITRTERKPPTYLTEAEAKRLLKTIQTRTGGIARRDTAIFDLFLKTGIRLQELVNLDVDDIRLDEKRLIVRHSKGDRQVAKFLNTPLRQTMKRYLAERKKAPADSTALFLSNRNERISPRQIAFRLDYWLRESGINKKLSPHGLRHTFATSLFAKCNDLLVVQRALDHKNLETTQIYTHISDERFQEALECL
ncbi:MAG: tyrosine-type recombinase/integrase [Victivallales bacterium]